MGYAIYLRLASAYLKLNVITSLVLNKICHAERLLQSRIRFWCFLSDLTYISLIKST